MKTKLNILLNKSNKPLLDWTTKKPATNMTELERFLLANPRSVTSNWIDFDLHKLRKLHSLSGGPPEAAV